MIEKQTTLKEKDFKKISRLVYSYSGICLKPGKEALVRARLLKRLRILKLDAISDYLGFLESDDGRDELHQMIDVMTTNKTSFFRENAHFDYMRNELIPKLNNRKIRFWCAACSSGQEPYSLAILLREFMPDIDRLDAKILATDISHRMIERGKAGQYSAASILDVPAQLVNKYFNRIKENGTSEYKVKEQIRRMVVFGRLNLMESWPMKGPFDAIFCRNVMIYFDRDTQQRLLERFWDLTKPGGFMFVGHSEGLSAISHRFQYIKPAIYRK